MPGLVTIPDLQQVNACREVKGWFLYAEHATLRTDVPHTDAFAGDIGELQLQPAFDRDIDVEPPPVAEWILYHLHAEIAGGRLQADHLAADTGATLWYQGEPVKGLPADRLRIREAVYM